jgi:branched-chain amino acid transport system substrate-binding protein
VQFRRHISPVASSRRRPHQFLNSPARRSLTSLLAWIVIAATVACGRTDTAPLRIGVVLDYDGLRGARLAAADVQAAGGIGGRPLELVVMPTGPATTAEPAIRAADSLATDPRVLGVVGHSNSAASLAASQVYNARGVVQLAPTTTAPLFGDAGPWSFRLVPDDRRQAEFIVRQAVADGARRIAMVYVNDDYGRALAASVRERLRAAGTPPVYETPYLETAVPAQLAASADAIVASQPELLLWLGRAPGLVKVLPLVRARIPRLRIYGSDGMDVSLVYQSTRQLDGVRFVRFIDPAASDSSLQRFRERFRAENHREVTTDAIMAYDATMLLASALRAGARTRGEVRLYLEGLDGPGQAYRGLSGPIVFDARGDVARPHLLAEVRADGVHAVSAR